ECGLMVFSERSHERTNAVFVNLIFSGDVKMFRKLILGLLLVLMVAPSFAQEEVVIRFQMYQDGIEAEVMTDLAERFNEANDGIRVDVEIVPYDFIIDQL